MSWFDQNAPTPVSAPVVPNLGTLAGRPGIASTATVRPRPDATQPMATPDMAGPQSIRFTDPGAWAALQAGQPMATPDMTPVASPGFQAPSGQGGSAQPNANYQQIFESLMAGRPLTFESLMAIQPELQKYGMDLVPNARGNAADLVLPNGQFVDVVRAFEGPEAGRALQWDLQPTFHDGQGGWYLPGGGQPGMAGGPASTAGLPWFTPPTGTDDPGFQFAMEEGQKALERSASAKGTLLTGGALKDLARYSTGMALQGYGDAWNRFDRTRNFHAGLLQNLSGMGLNAAGNYGGNAADILTGQGNAQAAATATRGANTANTINNLGNLGAEAILYRNRWSGPPQGRMPTTDETAMLGSAWGR